METLQISLDKRVADIAHSYAKERGESLSSIVEAYLRQVASQINNKKAHEEEVPDVVMSFLGRRPSDCRRRHQRQGGIRRTYPKEAPMKTIFADTNVVIDLLEKRESFYKDAVQYYSAVSVAADAIVTRNEKDFASNSELPVM